MVHARNALVPRQMVLVGILALTVTTVLLLADDGVTLGPGQSPGGVGCSDWSRAGSGSAGGLDSLVVSLRRSA